MMNFNRKSRAFGLVGIGIVGAIVTGGGVAANAATGDGTIPQPASTSASTVGARQFGHMAGMSFDENSPMTAVASYLGLTQTELQDLLQAGKSLADVAKSQSKSVSGLEDAMIAAMKTNLDANSTLTSGQKVAAVKQMRSRIDTMVNASYPPGQEMGMGMGMGMRMGMGMATSAP